jgi:Amt family ammonium transporter
VAKDQGPNHVHVSYPHDLAIIRRRGEMRWVAQLKTALEENQFRLHFQSVAAIDRPDDPAMCHELLLRLVNKRGELIQPNAFLPAAERYQLMSSIDQWVVENALRYLGQVVVPNPRLRGHRFGINLSGDSLRDGRLMQVIEDCLKRHGVPAAMLYFEVTETAAIANLGAAVDFIRRLKAFGCQLALDDFGSGMSSFSYLKHLPVDYLKIDGSFVKDLVNNPVDQAIVRSVHAVSRQMGIVTIAEYVESPAILECLRGIGIDYAQGFAIARPKPLEEFPLLMGNLRAASA